MPSKTMHFISGFSRSGCGVRSALAAVVIALNTQALAAPGEGTAKAAQDERRIRTQLISPDAVVISSELGGKIADLNLREGDAFKRGDKLVGLDCSLYEAQFKKAQASSDSARKLQQVTARMASLNATGELELEQSAAKAREAEAELNYMKTSMGKCQLTAPFDGRVARRMVAPHQFVAAGTPLLDIQSSSGLELQLIVPSHWLSWLKVGSNFAVSLEENAKTYPAQITRLGARIDPVSQTIAITARILNDNQELIPGMSGWADFNTVGNPVAQSEQKNEATSQAPGMKLVNQ